MKPKTRIQKEVARLSANLHPISATQIDWAYRHCVEHIGHRRQPHSGDSGEQAPCRAGSRPGIHTGEAPHPVRGVLPQAIGGYGGCRRVRGDNRRL